MAFDWSWLLVLVGALLVLIEVMLGGFAGFDLVLVGSTFILGGLLGVLTHNAVLGYIAASVLGVLYIAVGRRILRERLRPRSETRSNVDALRGRQGVVQQRIAAHTPGMVKLDAEVWRALPAPGVSGPFEVGNVVTVDSIDGVTLHVR